MRAVADHHVGPGIDRGVGNLGHVVEHLLAQPPMARGDDNVGLLAHRRDILGERREVGAVRPGDDDGRDAGPVHRRDLGPGLMRRHLIGGVGAQRGDAGAARAGLVVGRPVDRAALDKTHPYPAALDDRRRPRRGEVLPGAGVGDAEPVQPGDRAEDRGAAVIDVVRETDRGKPGELQRLAADRRVGEEPFLLDGVAVGRLVQQAFEVAVEDMAPANSSSSRANGTAGSSRFIRFTSPTRIIVDGMAILPARDVSMLRLPRPRRGRRSRPRYRPASSCRGSPWSPPGRALRACTAQVRPDAAP